ncbi:alpha/beta fold hydrolase [Sphingosinicella sp.]|uniref:alpha/beta fold hydrolase n=1 Tax=Sphingosinicella sp. TaxID=1917971 RepID=UPI004037D66D
MIPTLVLLPGALGAMEGSRRIAAGLAGTRPIATIDYRPDDLLDTLFERIDTAGGNAPFDLLGQSYGGWIAQCFARRHPGRIRRLVLSHSFVLRPSDAGKLRVAGFLLTRLPRAMTRRLLLGRIRKAIAPVRAARPEVYARRLRDLEQAFDAGLIDIFAAQQVCMAESLRPRTDSVSGDLPPTLIIDSDNDPIIGARARAALRAAHPQAEHRSFAGAGHSSATIETGAFLATVREFLDR